MDSLKKVYDSIAGSWSKLKTKPMDFVVNFLTGKEGLLCVAGCGSARNSKYASEQDFKVIGFDFSIEMIKIAKQRDPDGFYLVGNVKAMPFKDNIFDHSVCPSVLHHLKPDEVVKALKELKRVTKKESLISFWNHPKLKGEHFIKWGDYKRYYYLYNHEQVINLVKQVFNNFKEIPARDNFVLEV